MIHSSKETLRSKVKKITKITVYPLYCTIVAITALMNKVYYHIRYNKNEKNNIKHYT